MTIGTIVICLVSVLPYPGKLVEITGTIAETKNAWIYVQVNPDTYILVKKDKCEIK